MFIRFNKLNANEYSEHPDMKKLGNAYPFPFRIVNTHELEQLILSGRPLKYLVYVRSSTDKFIDVYDGQTGDLLYAEYVKMSYNFKEKDLRPLARAIR